MVKLEECSFEQLTLAVRLLAIADNIFIYLTVKHLISVGLNLLIHVCKVSFVKDVKLWLRWVN